jgi:hypothetical protein
MFAAFLLASSAIVFSMKGMDSAVDNPEPQEKIRSCFLHYNEVSPPNSAVDFSKFNQT